MVGLAGLRRLRPLTSCPLVAIGGITRANAPEVLAAGADSVAVIGDLFPEDGNLRARAREWLAATFDSQNRQVEIVTKSFAVVRGNGVGVRCGSWSVSRVGA